MQALPDGCPDGLGPEAEALDQLQSDAVLNLAASDASADALPDATAGVLLAHPRLAADAERLAGQEPDVPVQGGLQSAVPGAAAPPGALCKPDAVQFAARSFEGQALADAAVEPEQRVAQPVPAEPKGRWWGHALEPQERSLPAQPRVARPV